MTAEIYKIRDYQSKRAIERAHKELEKEAAKILESVPYEGKGIDGMDFEPKPA
jgi:hypothetical protein